MITVDDALRQYLKKEYPVIAVALETRTVSGNELWLVDIAMRAFRQGYGSAPRLQLTERHDSFLTRLAVGGCTCMTKTPELQYHAEDCTYRLATEIALALGDK